MLYFFRPDLEGEELTMATLEGPTEEREVIGSGENEEVVVEINQELDSPDRKKRIRRYTQK